MLGICIATIEQCVFSTQPNCCVLFYLEIIVNDKESTAVFIGNRDCYGVNIESIKETILYTIQSGITTFLSGGQGYFDEVCATIVYQLKTTHPHIKNILMIPYHSFRIFDKSIFDEIVYPFDSYESSYLTYRNAIPERNRVMVMRSRIAISYVYRNGGASKTLELARSNGLEIIDLFSLSLKNEIKLKYATLQ